MAQSTELFVRAITHILIKNGALDAKEEQAIDLAFQKSEHERFDDFLISEGMVEPEDLLHALSEYYKVPAFDVVDYFFNHSYLHLFPKEVLLKYAMIPAEREDDILVMIVADPTNTDLLVECGKYVSYDIQFCVGIYQDIVDAIQEYYDRSPTDVDEDEQSRIGDGQEHIFQMEVDATGAEIDQETELNEEGLVIQQQELQDDEEDDMF